MKKTIRFFSIALALLMILPMLAALPVKVNATEPAIGYNKTYAAASDGELLYKADFRGNDGVWTTGAVWNGMVAGVASDGSSVTLRPTGSGDARGSAWGKALNTTNYRAIGCAYTVTFTVEGSNDNQYVGFYPDWKTGFIITPGQKKVSVGQSLEGQTADLTAVAGNTTYTSRTSGAQTYAVEFAVSDTKNGDYYVCTTYKLYVKDGAQWKLIRELNETERSKMTWSDEDYEVVLRFFRNTVSGQTGQTVTVSDLNVYKGLIVPSAIAYADAEDGDLLYHADFRGSDGVWTTGAAWNGMAATAAADGQSVTLRPTGSGDPRGSVWGKALNTTNYRTIGCAYTVTFTLQGSNNDQYIGFYPDWKTGFIIYPGQKKVSAGRSLGGQTADLTAIAGETTYTGGGNGAQTYAVEYAVSNTKNGDYYVCTTYKIYVRDGGQWKLIRELDETERSKTTWSDDDYEMVLRFFRNTVSGQTGQTVTVSDLNVYRGLCASTAVAYDDAEPRDLLYHADFRGTDGVWSPKRGWGGMSASVAADGSSVTLKPNQTLDSMDRSVWGGDLNQNDYPAIGSSYTVTFTLESSDANQFVGFYTDWYTGFVFTPGQKKVSLGQWGNQNLTEGPGNVIYTGGGNGAQTYAVEFAVSNDKRPDSEFYVCTTYRLYVWDGAQWKLICSLNKNQRDLMQWSDTDPETVLRFYRSPTADGQTGTVTVSDLNVYRGFLDPIRTAEGAAVRLGTPTGLRFTGYVDKNYLDDLEGEYGAANVKVGMFVTPTDYLTANSLAFTKAALDGCGAITGAKYKKIEATTKLDSEDGTAYKINCVLSNVLEANYSRRFSAITYVEINGSTYVYSRYDEAQNARSIACVAEAALYDVSGTQADEYQWAVGDGTYSPYTSAQRTTLAGFRRSVSVMSYNIEVYDHPDDSGWDGRNAAKVIETITTVSPDILGLQEVSSTGWSSYISTLTSNGYSRIQGDTSRNSWPELFYKTARFNKLNSGYKRYSVLRSEYPGVPENGADPSRDMLGRLFTWARLEDKETGKIVLAISTHLHYRKDKSDTASTDENAAVRQYEIRLMLAWIEAQVFDYDAVVVVGDMNDDYQGSENGRGRRTINEYRNNGFAVARDSASFRGDVGGTLDGTGENEVKRSLRNVWIYDYILTKGNASTAYFTVVDNKIDNGGTTYPSDHLPIMATILFD